MPKYPEYGRLAADLTVLEESAGSYGELTVRRPNDEGWGPILQIVHGQDFRGNGWNTKNVHQQVLYYRILNAAPSIARPLISRFVDIQPDPPLQKGVPRTKDTFIIGILDDDSARQTENEWRAAYSVLAPVSRDVKSPEKAFALRWRRPPNITLAFVEKDVPTGFIEEAMDIALGYLHVDIQLEMGSGSPTIAPPTYAQHFEYLKSLE